MSGKTIGPSRRRFLSQVGAAVAGGVVLGKAAIASAQSNPLLNREDGAPLATGAIDPRVRQAYAIRKSAAMAQARVPVPPHTTNGDEQRYADKSGTYTKGILQDGIELVNLAAFQTFRHAIDSGRFEDFENVITGGPRTMNGPLGGRAFALEGSDDVQFGNGPSPANQINQVVVPPAPALASEAYGTELVELYWASLLRDVAFTDYASHPIAIQAAAELSSMPAYAGTRDAFGNVTPELLFRGTYPGENRGPLLSQFYTWPTYMGVQPVGQQLVTFQPGVDYMTDAATFQQVQNGIDTRAPLQVRSATALHARRPRALFVHARRRALPELLHRLPRARHDGRAG